MNKYVNAISGRLSLRKPQRRALEILDRITEITPLHKGIDINSTLQLINAEFPNVTAFERSFPSLCFSLATGVGKTRLMGAFIAYLHLAKKIKHFCVLAPNLTIYNKLVTDFSPNTPKYVLSGISEFAVVPPEIITGDNFESGRGIRGADILGRNDSVQINIFNISKINSDLRSIKDFSEFQGESYFDYLSNLDDLVLIMDESHRYRANSGVKALNALNPILGLELTATPQVESGKKPISFKNVIYNYPLFDAMEDGYVKEPAVATRENFKSSDYTDDQLERIKLEDGIKVHEQVKLDLKLYASNNNLDYVKPFILIVSQDTLHAERLLNIVKSADFFDGRYKHKVITVHSAKKGEERDETIAKLLSVESPNETTEIVIHVNMLKEGWDVTNLFTIIPLRAANSKTLVEQSIGRGLRLPYGRRTGIPAVDRLTIIAHDKFDEIISDANDKSSIIRKGILIGKDIDLNPQKIVEIPSKLDFILGVLPGGIEINVNNHQLPNDNSTILDKTEFTDAERPVILAAREVIEQYYQLSSSKKLSDPAILDEITRKVEEKLRPDQLELMDSLGSNNTSELVGKVAKYYYENIIDIPRIVLQPKEAIIFNYNDFDLDTHNFAQLNPVDQQILIQELRTNIRDQIDGSSIFINETRPEDYIVLSLMDYADISYKDTSDLLYKLSSQLIDHLRSYLTNEDDVLNVIQFYRKKLGEVIYSQMKHHLNIGKNEYDVNVTRGFIRPKLIYVSADNYEAPRYYRDNVQDKNNIRKMIFYGFKKCLYPSMKFHSDTERQFSLILEDEGNVIKWMKPSREDLRIYYTSENLYQPDFVVETDSCKYIIETKMERDISTQEVVEKMKAAILWCIHATNHAKDNEGKPWNYVLIPHSSVQPSATFTGLLSQYIKSNI